MCEGGMDTGRLTGTEEKGKTQRKRKGDLPTNIYYELFFIRQNVVIGPRR